MILSISVYQSVMRWLRQKQKDWRIEHNRGEMQWWKRESKIFYFKTIYLLSISVQFLGEFAPFVRCWGEWICKSPSFPYIKIKLSFSAIISERNLLYFFLFKLFHKLNSFRDQQMNLEREQRGSNRHLHRKAKASSANDRRKEKNFRQLQRQHQTLVTEMNALEILRDSVNNLQVTR